MSDRIDIAPTVHVDVTTRGDLPGAAEYARTKIADLSRFVHRPLAHAHVKLTRHGDPDTERPVLAQGNLDLNGRLVRAEAEGETARDAIDRLEERLRRRLRRAADHWEARRDGRTIRVPDEADAEPTQRPTRLNVAPDERQIVRRKSFTLAPCTVDEAALEMALLDYDFHLFTEERTGMASVLYKDGPTGHRLAQVQPASEEELAPFELPLTISPQPAPCLTVEQAAERMGLLGLPFMFFIDAAQGRAAVLYHRYDGHYGLITPAG
ncbi:HPF/RaiA family ribosome-associated protein [Mycolicibacterium novocastrense]|uniref:Ribosome-associated protein n=1 Tax=Mycolicibacterium novocastrense TaxID=59813 RepID=A0AAW5SK22_MYCNV|nr:HPF/RaiA family ribosome-associated protein [Mycolicibacterium novocastrense]MCV7023817.1 HPF/RaiA family ribosome-associated protein [Mycolicibacterium novocastrense]GAT11249.1 ribosome-associated protein [Mycolicibacterium novocastrense]